MRQSEPVSRFATVILPRGRYAVVELQTSSRPFRDTDTAWRRTYRTVAVYSGPMAPMDASEHRERLASAEDAS